jgi:predicted CoA-binding protein
MDEIVRSFLEAKRLAIVGVSRSPQKFGTTVYTELKQRGFQVFGVNPAMETIAGDRCYASVTELAGQVDGVVICLPPVSAATVLREAAAVGINKIWLQQGASSAETTQAGREVGVTPVEGKCILMYAGEVKSVHAVHRFFARLFGQY